MTLEYDRSAPVYAVLDVFPSLVSGPDPLLPQRRVRTVLASPVRRFSDADFLDLYVFADLAPPGLLLRVRTLPPPSYPSLSRDAPLSLTADPGPGVYTVSVDGSCGCGSRLRNFRAFSSWARARP